MVRIAPSILSANLGNLEAEIRAMEAAGADWIHIDVMDGHFVPNITFGPWAVREARRVTRLPLDVHLMISEPLVWAPVFAKAGADFVAVHTEATPHLDRCLDLIRDAGARTGLALNPSTPLSVLDDILEKTDLVVLMGVNPGFSGQKFIPNTVPKTARLAAMLAGRGLSPEVEIDGGVTDLNAAPLAGNGATVLVSGSHLFGSGDYGAAVKKLRRNADRGLG
jgi:ribulose-phosphate 3-epimerase